MALSPAFVDGSSLRDPLPKRNEVVLPLRSVRVLEPVPCSGTPRTFDDATLERLIALVISNTEKPFDVTKAKDLIPHHNREVFKANKGVETCRVRKIP